MINKKFMILAIFLVSLLAVSAVSAADNATEDIVGVGNNDKNQTIEESSNEEILSGTNDGTFTDLQNKIDKAAEGSTIYLYKDYKYDEGFSKEGISISKSLTIAGNGHTLDGLSKSRILYVSTKTKDSEIFLKDINFCNGYANDAGGVMAYGSAVNCTFINNSASHGGAISFGSAVNCSFVNNTADSGGAMAYGSAVNCTFIGNFAEAYGGSMYVSYPVNCTFINNTAIYGGAMASSSAVNCTFMGNIVPKFGGAAYSCKINSCIFKGKSTGMGDNDVFPKLATFLTTKYDRDTKKIVAVVKDEDGNAVSGVKVGFACNGVKYFVTDANGQAIFPTSSLSGGSNAVKVMAYGNNLYYNSNQETVTVTKELVKIYLRNALYFVLQTKYVTVTLSDANNKPIANKTVYIRLNDNGWKYSGVTDENGNALIRVGVGFGNHPATVSFEGDDIYGSCSKTGRVRVIKETPSLMLPGAYTKFKASDATKTIKVYLKDRYNKPLLKDTKVFVTINGKQYVGQINNEGIASININLNKAGVYNVDLYYTGNTAYNAVKRQTKITIV